MGYFKKFTDFCAALAGAHGAVFFLIRFMMFEPQETVSSVEKLKLFLAKEHSPDYRSLLVLIFFLMLSALMGRLLRKHPVLSLPFALFSFTFVMYLLDCNKLYERPMLYVVLVSLHVVGSLADCLMRDKEDGYRRAFYAANLTALAAPAFCWYLLDRLPKVAEVPMEELQYFDSKLVVAQMLQEDFAALRPLIWMCVGCVLISVLLRNLYYIGAMLSLIPLGYTIFIWETERVSTFCAILVPLLVITVVFRVTVMFLESSEIKKMDWQAWKADTKKKIGKLTQPFHKKKETL